MDLHLAVFAESNGGLFTRSAAIVAGYSDADIRVKVSRGEWHRIRRGAYCDAEWWAELDPADRHTLTARAVALRCGNDAVFTHVTGAVLRGWPTWNVRLDEVCVTRTGGHHGRQEAGVHHFMAELPPEQVEQVGALSVSSKERLMVEVARQYDLEPAVVIADAALRDGADRELALQISQSTSSWPRARGVVAAVIFADGRAENPAESRLRLGLHLRGLTGFVPQQPLRTPHGRLLGRGDLADPETRVLVEFDGKSKYGIDGSDPRQQLWEEKLREDAVREQLMYEVVRVTWQQLDDMATIAHRVRAAIARSMDRRSRAA